MLTTRLPVREERAATAAAIRVMALLNSGVVAVAALYFGQELLIPLVLAGLLAFVLAPLARLLHRVCLPHVAGRAAGRGDGLRGHRPAQCRRRPADRGARRARCPAYQANIMAKWKKLRESNRLVAEIAVPLEAGAACGGSGCGSSTWAERFARPLLGPLDDGAVVLVFTLVILLYSEDLRDRFVRLVGRQDLHRTIFAMNDAGRRLSRYFLSQLSINAAFGAVGRRDAGRHRPAGAILLGATGGADALRAVHRHLRRAGCRRSAWPSPISPDWTLALLVLGFFAGQRIRRQPDLRAAALRPQHRHLAGRRHRGDLVLGVDLGLRRPADRNPAHRLPGGDRPQRRQPRFLDVLFGSELAAAAGRNILSAGARGEVDGAAGGCGAAPHRGPLAADYLRPRRTSRPGARPVRPGSRSRRIRAPGTGARPGGGRAGRRARAASRAMRRTHRPEARRRPVAAEPGAVGVHPGTAQLDDLAATMAVPGVDHAGFGAPVRDPNLALENSSAAIGERRRGGTPVLPVRAGGRQQRGRNPYFVRRIQKRLPNALVVVGLWHADGQSALLAELRNGGRDEHLVLSISELMAYATAVSAQKEPALA